MLILQAAALSGRSLYEGSLDALLELLRGWRRRHLRRRCLQHVAHVGVPLSVSCDVVGGNEPRDEVVCCGEGDALRAQLTPCLLIDTFASGYPTTTAQLPHTW